MGKINTLFRLIKNDKGSILKAAFLNFSRSRISHLMPDDLYLKYQYRANMGERLNLVTPVTFNEKLQWLKLHDRKKKYTKMVDKSSAKEIFAQMIGKDHIIKTYGCLLYTSWSPEKLEKQIKFMSENGYHFSYTNYEEIDEQGKSTGTKVTGPKKVSKQGMYNYCYPGCLTVMYDAESVGLVQIQDIKKNNDYAMWLKVCQKADCWLLDEYLGQYRKGRSGSISSHSIKTMIGWHYKLWHEAESKNAVMSIWYTCLLYTSYGRQPE